MDLAAMIGQLDVGPLVPEQYAQYRRIVADGVVFFLQRLSGERLAGVLQEQMSLPLDADVAQRFVHLMHSCPTLHKLGQVVARRRELDEGFRRRLQRLESMEPHTPVEQVMPIITRELGGAIRQWQIRIDQNALAEASVAVVVPFTWLSLDGDGSSRRHGVLKVLKPNITQYLEEDLRILGELADYLDQQQEAYGLPEIDYRDTFDEVRTILRSEILMPREQAHLAHAAERNTRPREVQIPEVLPFSTPHMTAMQHVYGVKVTDLRGKTRAGIRHLARTVVRALVADVLFSRQPQAMFHGDPHAGNLMATTDGRLGILDWSLAGELTLRDRMEMAQILVGAFSMDAQRIGRAIEALASSPPTEGKLRPLIERGLGEVRRRGIPRVDWLMRLLDSAAQAGVRFRPDLMLFRKAYFTLEGVVADLGSNDSMQQILMETALEELAGEWPLRWMRLPDCRDYPTHLSNLDLLRIVSGLPIAVMNWWMAKAVPA